MTKRTRFEFWLVGCYLQLALYIIFIVSHDCFLYTAVFFNFSVKRSPLQQFSLFFCRGDSCVESTCDETTGNLKFAAKGREWWRGSWTGGSEPPPHQLWGLGSTVSCLSGFGLEPWPQIHSGPTMGLENVSSGRKCRTQSNFLLSTSSPAEPLDTTGRGTPVEKHWYTETCTNLQPRFNAKNFHKFLAQDSWVCHWN